MLNKYTLNGKIIETTEQRYNSTFKGMGYVPYVEKVTVEKAEIKEDKQVSVENKKNK